MNNNNTPMNSKIRTNSIYESVVLKPEDSNRVSKVLDFDTLK